MKGLGGQRSDGKKKVVGEGSSGGTVAPASLETELVAFIRPVCAISQRIRCYRCSRPLPDNNGPLKSHAPECLLSRRRLRHMSLLGRLISL